MTGGWEINTTTVTALEYFYNAYLIGVLGAPIIIAVFMLCLSPVCCCVALNRKEMCFQSAHRLLMSLSKYIFQFLKKVKATRPGDEESLKLFGFFAPSWYVYFLIYVFFVIVFHCMFAFLGDAIQLETVRVYNYSSIPVCSDVYGYSCIYYRNAHVLEIKLIKGFEAATFTLAATVFFFSLVSISLVKCSGGKMPKSRETSCFCHSVHSCRRIMVFLVQAVMFIAPRLGASVYVVFARKYSPVNNDSNDVLFTSNDDGTSYNTVKLIDVSGLFDEESYFFLVAVCDSISIAMLTPWYSFKSKNKGSYDVNGVV